MGRMATYLFILSGLNLLFYFGGLVESNPILNLLLQPENLSTSSVWVLLVGGLFSAAGITIGFVARNAELSIMSILLPGFLIFLFPAFQIYNVVAAQNKVIALLVIAPIMLLFVMTGLEWWRGRD